MRTIQLLLFAFVTQLCLAQGWYASGSLSAGSGPDMGAHYGSVEAGATFGTVGVGACIGRDLAAHEDRELYFVEVRGTQNLILFDDGPQPYVCGGVGQYLDGRWVTEFGAGLSWPSGIGIGACSFGGGGYVTASWTGSWSR